MRCFSKKRATFSFGIRIPYCFLLLRVGKCAVRTVTEADLQLIVVIKGMEVGAVILVIGETHISFRFETPS